MAKPKTKVPNLSNATPEFCVDELGDIRAEIKELQSREAIFKEALHARRGNKTEIIGERWRASITTGSRTTLDLDAVRAKLGEKWCEEHSNTTEFDTIRTTKVED